MIGVASYGRPIVVIVGVERTIIHYSSGEVIVYHGTGTGTGTQPTTGTTTYPSRMANVEAFHQPMIRRSSCVNIRYHHQFELSRADRHKPSTICLAPRELRPLRESRDTDGWRLHVQVVSHTGRGL